MMQEDMSPYMTDLLTQLIAKLAAVSKVFIQRRNEGLPEMQRANQCGLANYRI
jgi:hypothetical protein